MQKIYLVYWNAIEAEDKAALLQQAGYVVAYELPSPAIFREIRKHRPTAFVIDLSRLPSHRRDVALSLRQSKATRMIPLVFVDGDPEKVARVKDHLPDAIYTTWSRIRSSLKRAISHPPQNPVVPRSVLDGYANAPLLKKLGIKPNMSICLINEPVNFINDLGPLPEDTIFSMRVKKSTELIIWFVQSQKKLQIRINTIKAALADKDGLWIAWPKKTSNVKSDLSQEIVRKIGLASGLVDFKVCSIDETWSGLKFVKRKTK